MTESPVRAMLELAELCEKATGPDRELFITAYQAAFPDGYTQDRSGYNYDRWTRFLQLLDAKAWLDAAMTLAEPFMLVALSDIAADGLTGCCLCSDTSTNPPTEHWSIPRERPASRQGILALAVCAAALRARAADTPKVTPNDR